MAYKSDIEIAQECTMAPITEVAAKAGIDDRYLEQYGKYKGENQLQPLKRVRRPGRKTGAGNRYQSHSRGRGKDHHHRGAGGRPAENRQKIRGRPA